MTVTLPLWLAVWTIFLYVTTALLVTVFAYRVGRRMGQRFEVVTMIDLLGSLKIDNWEQRVFRDRFIKALKWSLTVSPKTGRKEIERAGDQSAGGDRTE